MSAQRAEHIKQMNPRLAKKETDDKAKRSLSKKISSDESTSNPVSLLGDI